MLFVLPSVVSLISTLTACSPLHALLATLQERGKFQKETRVNVGGRLGRSSLAEKK